MDAASPLVVGIDLAAGRGVTALAALDSSALPAHLVALAQPRSDDDIIQEALRHTPSVIAIDAPLTLPGPVMAALTGTPSPGGSVYQRAAELDPLWRTLGVRPLPVSFLGGLTFRAISLAARLHEELPYARIIEAFPTGALAALDAHAAVTPRGSKVAKTTRARRLATLKTLARWVDGLASLGAESEPPDADTLDALLAALTAVAFARGVTTTIGAVAEGCIILPDSARFSLPRASEGAEGADSMRDGLFQPH